MAYLTAEILIYLAIAAVLGLAIGFLIWGWGRAEALDAARQAGAREAETDALARADRPANAAEVAALKAEIERLEGDKTSIAADLTAAESARDSLSAHRVRLENETEQLKRQVAALEADLAACRASAGKAAPADPPPTEVPELETAKIEAPRAPATLLTERPSEVDDLKLIKGVGPKMESILNGKGVFLFHQLANFGPEDVAWVNEAIEAFPGRIERDEWVAQTQELYREKYGKRHDAS